MSFPNGNNPMPATLKHCTPNGMPTTVMQRIIPAATYSSQMMKPPPKMIHRTFRSVRSIAGSLGPENSEEERQRQRTGGCLGVAHNMVGCRRKFFFAHPYFNGPQQS